ncbi:MAG: hypothetical protein ACI9U2_000771 [Bradymonadia bacterium]|jgi:hypothetical protein
MSNARRFVDDWLGTIFSPQETFAALSARPAPRRGALAMCVLGGLWAILFFWLGSDGRTPTFTRWLPVAAADYYTTAALYVLPLFLALWLIFAQLAQLLCGRSPFTTTLSVLGFAYAVPVTMLFVIPDMVVYAANGQIGLAQAIRVTAPLTLIWTLVLSTIALRVVHRVTRWQAIRSAVIAFVLQALPAAILLR